MSVNSIEKKRIKEQNEEACKKRCYTCKNLNHVTLKCRYLDQLYHFKTKTKRGRLVEKTPQNHVINSFNCQFYIPVNK